MYLMTTKTYATGSYSPGQHLINTYFAYAKSTQRVLLPVPLPHKTHQTNTAVFWHPSTSRTMTDPEITTFRDYRMSEMCLGSRNQSRSIGLRVKTILSIFEKIMALVGVKEEKDVETVEFRLFKYLGESLPVVVTLDDLIFELRRIFESGSINIELVNYLMKSYKSNPVEWRKYAKFDRYRYTRNLVDVGNGKYNLMILCWGEGQGSSIHDHADAHCFMKILKGSLEEVRFAWPEVEGRPLQEKGRKNLALNDVAYINDSLGLHRVENPSNVDGAVSLHLYCPPFDKCSVFNRNSGQRSTAKVTFWSVYGERLKREEKWELEDN